MLQMQVDIAVFQLNLIYINLCVTCSPRTWIDFHRKKKKRESGVYYQSAFNKLHLLMSITTLFLCLYSYPTALSLPSPSCWSHYSSPVLPFLLTSQLSPSNFRIHGRIFFQLFIRAPFWVSLMHTLCLTVAKESLSLVLEKQVQILIQSLTSWMTSDLTREHFFFTPTKVMTIPPGQWSHI